MMTDDWSLGYTSVTGDEDIVIGGHRLRVIYAPVLFTCIILVGLKYLVLILFKAHPLF